MSEADRQLSEAVFTELQGNFFVDTVGVSNVKPSTVLTVWIRGVKRDRPHRAESSHERELA